MPMQSFMNEVGMEAFVKYNRFHIEQRPRYKPNPFHHDNFHYNAAEDYYVCPMGQHMTRIGTSHSKTASGYRSENARYRAHNYKSCPLQRVPQDTRPPPLPASLTATCSCSQIVLFVSLKMRIFTQNINKNLIR